MSGLFDIGKSGIETYKHALSVTGQNIANAGTQGYHRREVLVAERKLTQSDSLNIQDQLGLGAKIDKVSRAFDTLSFFKLIKTNSALRSAETVSEYLVGLENQVTKNNQNLFSDVGELFKSLSSVQAAPNGIPERQSVLLAAEQLTNRIVNFSSELSAIKEDLSNEASILVSTTNTIIDGLVEVQKSLQTVGASSFSPSSLLDQRDQLLKDLSDNLEISIQYQNSQKVRVGLGQNFGPNDLVDGFASKQLSLTSNNGGLTFFLDGVKVDTVSGGKLGGILKAQDIIDASIANLNSFALTLAKEFNDIQKTGIDLNGANGTSLFSIPTVEILRADGSISNISFENDTALQGEYSLKYDANSSSFLDTQNENELQLNGGFLTLENKSLFIGTEFSDGETINLKPIDNFTGNMVVSITDPSRLAASKSLSIKSDIDNNGSAVVGVSRNISVPQTSKLSVGDDFKTNNNPSNAKSFIAETHVSLIDSDISEIAVSAFSEQSSTRFSLSSDEITNLKSGEITIKLDNNDTIIFDVGSNDTWTDLSSLSELLNNGSIKSDNDNINLRSLGIVATANQSTITFTQANNTTQRSTSVQLLDETINMEPAPISNSDVYIFTKEGRQLSGPTLTDDEASNLLTPANGFNSDAVYISQYSNSSYRGAFSDVSFFHGDPKETKGFIKQSEINGGKTKTVEFSTESKNFLTQVNSSTASANIIDTTVTAELNDNFKATLSFSEDADIDLSNVGSLLATELRKLASATASSSLSFNQSSLGKIETFSINFEGKDYSGKIIFPDSLDKEVTTANVVIDGLEERFIPVLTKNNEGTGFDLKISANHGVPTAESIAITSAATSASHEISIQTDINVDNFSKDLGSLILDDGREVNLGVVTNDGSTIDEFEITIVDNGGKAQIVIANQTSSNSFRYQPSETISSDTKVLSQRLSASPNNLIVTELDNGGGNPLTVDISSNVRSLTSLKDLPDEELLLVLENTEDTKYAVEFLRSNQNSKNNSNFELTLKSSELGLYELTDSITGDSIGTRFDTGDGILAFDEFTFEISGTPAENDSFVVAESLGGGMKSDNIQEMLKLDSLDPSKRGNLHAQLDNILFDISKHISSAEIYKEAAEGSKIAVEEMIDKYSSVSLDVEAANLMQQQQAYQALARVLSTAKEMIETLMEVT